MSAAVALPVFIIKLPWNGAIWAPPQVRPLSPQSSISLPEGAPKAWLFLKTLPALGYLKWPLSTRSAMYFLQSVVIRSWAEAPAGVRRKVAWVM